jgi:hypothetical protein
MRRATAPSLSSARPYISPEDSETNLKTTEWPLLLRAKMAYYQSLRQSRGEAKLLKYQEGNLPRQVHLAYGSSYDD